MSVAHVLAPSALMCSGRRHLSGNRSTNVATFLALLELVRGGRIALDDRGALTMRRTRPERNEENP